MTARNHFIGHPSRRSGNYCSAAASGRLTFLLGERRRFCLTALAVSVFTQCDSRVVAPCIAGGKVAGISFGFCQMTLRRLFLRKKNKTKENPPAFTLRRCPLMSGDSGKKEKKAKEKSGSVPPSFQNVSRLLWECVYMARRRTTLRL